MSKIIGSTKSWEYRCVGTVPAGSTDDQIREVVLRAVAWLDIIQPFRSFATVTILDESPEALQAKHERALKLEKP